MVVRARLSSCAFGTNEVTCARSQNVELLYGIYRVIGVTWSTIPLPSVLTFPVRRIARVRVRLSDKRRLTTCVKSRGKGQSYSSGCGQLT